MNILFYNGNAIQPTKGGISKITYVLGELFRNHGHDVYYVTLKPYSGNDCITNQLFIDKENALESLIEIVKSHDINIIINQFQFGKQIVDLLYNCKQRCPGLKIISCYHNSILTPIYNIAYQRELPLKMHHAGFLFHLLKLPLVNKTIVACYIKKHRSQYMHVYNKSDQVIMLCEGQRDEFIKMSGVKDTSKLEVIYNTYDSSEEVFNEEKRKRVIWVGTFDFMVKRPDYMLRAWALIQDKHPEWELFMLGDGPSLPYMKSLANKMKLKRIIFTGRVMPEKYYQISIIHCVTSTHEAFSMVTLEAKANRCASILPTCFTSAPLLIHDGIDGKLIKPFSHESLAEALDQLMSNPTELLSMQYNAYKDLDRFSGETIYIKWQKLFETIC